MVAACGNSGVLRPGRSGGVTFEIGDIIQTRVAIKHPDVTFKEGLKGCIWYIDAWGLHHVDFLGVHSGKTKSQSYTADQIEKVK